MLQDFQSIIRRECTRTKDIEHLFIKQNTYYITRLHTILLVWLPRTVVQIFPPSNYLGNIVNSSDFNIFRSINLRQGTADLTMNDAVL
jgi:hypothetical protein